MRAQILVKTVSFGLVCSACPPQAESLGAGPGTTGPESSGSAGDVPTSGAASEETGTGGSTTGAEGSTSVQPGTEVVVPFCGNGEVESFEECDSGLEGNKNTAFCTEDCTLNVCGDGKHFLGWELCDLGEFNDDAYGSHCTNACEPGSWCGDGIVDAEFGESCDLGPDNGTDQGDGNGIPCESTCHLQTRRAFVTSEAFSGDLGGLDGADTKCRVAAAEAGLAEPDRFVAYLSSGVESANQRYGELLPASAVLVTVTGTTFAGSYAELIATGPLGEGVNTTETGEAIHYVFVATNTDPDGTAYAPDQSCEGWTSDDPKHQVRFGFNAFPGDSMDWMTWQSMGLWVSADSLPCDTLELHLYCFEI